MSWKRFLVVATVGCTLTIAGCSDAGTALSTDDWVTLKGEHVSLKLPDSFVGGDPYDPAVVAAFERVYGYDPGADENAPPAGVEFLLAAWEPPLGVPEVVATRGPLGLSQSMKEEAEQWLALQFSEDQFTVETSTENRVYAVVRAPSPQDADVSLVAHFVWEALGTHYYMLMYRCLAEDAATYEPIFRASAETIVIKGQ